MTTQSIALHEMAATDLMQAFAKRSLSPVDVMLSVVAQIERCEPTLCATYLFRPELAIAQAKLSEARWQAGNPMGTLDGVPVTIKENLATQGDPLPAGTAAVALVPALNDSPVAARLRESGAIMVSKTTMPDYGMLSSGLSTFHHLSRNPWDTSKGPGGSSAGAGSAAAAGYGPLHVGTDIGGSVRLPAGWCGVYGLKPSLGRVPIDPPYIGRAAGPMTRTVADAALMMQVLSQADPRDSMSLPAQALAWDQTDCDVAQLKGLRIGLMLDAGCGMAVDPLITAAIQNAAQLFERAGAIIEPMAPYMTPAMLDGVDHFFRMRSCIDIENLSEDARANVLPFIREWALSASDFSGRHVFNANTQPYNLRIAAVRACQPFDYIISPVAPVMPFKAENACPSNDPMKALEHIGFTLPSNMSEQPAASINCGYAMNENGKQMPIGLQIIGKRFDDIGVLKVSSAFEKIRAAQLPWPTHF